MFISYILLFQKNFGLFITGCIDLKLEVMAVLSGILTNNRSKDLLDFRK